MNFCIIDFRLEKMKMNLKRFIKGFWNIDLFILVMLIICPLLDRWYSSCLVKIRLVGLEEVLVSWKIIRGSLLLTGISFWRSRKKLLIFLSRGSWQIRLLQLWINRMICRSLLIKKKAHWSFRREEEDRSLLLKIGMLSSN